MVLEWATFATAALAAVGSFLGPVLAYRSAATTAADARRQADVDRYISFALQPDVVTCRMGTAQLQYLLDAGELTTDQRHAVAVALTAGLRRLQEEVDTHPGAVPAVADPPATPALDGSAGSRRSDRRERALRAPTGDGDDGAGAGARVVAVTGADVQRARLLLAVDASLDRSTPAAVRAIADAEPGSGSPDAGTA